MYGKLILGIALTSLASASMAMEITHGKLLSHKEWVTGKGVGSFSAVDPRPKSRLHKAHKISHDNPVGSEGVQITSSVIDMGDIKVGSPVTFGSVSYVWILNDSQSVQTYKINGRLCSYGNGVQQGCNLFEDVITLDPQGIAMSDRWPRLSLSYEKAGKYVVEAATSVDKGQINFESNDNIEFDVTA